MIIPVLNRFDLLDKTLKTIDHPVDEILIINNSADESNIDLIKDNFEDLNIRVLNLPSNMGIAGSWNLGIKLYPHANYWVIASADTRFLPGSIEKMEYHSASQYFIKSDSAYDFFSVGSSIIDRIGLFDEYIYPAYFEDNDFDDRMVLAGLSECILSPGIPVIEDDGGSQTIKSNGKYNERNNETFVSNSYYYHQKKSSGDYTPKGWNLARRRYNDWDR